MPTPPTPPQLLSPDRLTSRLRLAVGNPAAADALTRASARFIASIGYSPLEASDDVVTLDGNSTETLLLPGAPVTAVTVVKLDGTAITDWTRSSRLGMLYRRSGWPWGFGNIEVTYSHGWPLEDLPEDIADAVLEQAEALYRTPAGIAQTSAGPQSASFNTMTGGGAGATERWTEAVARYRRAWTLPA